jgi:hypothetical protein
MQLEATPPELNLLHGLARSLIDTILEKGYDRMPEME